MYDEANSTSAQEQQLIDGMSAVECDSTEIDFSPPEHLHVSIHRAFTLEQSEPRPLYFAYGSNLSHTQMRKRCTANPDVSAKPVGIARLDNWRWFICGRGYANVLPLETNGIGGVNGDAKPTSSSTLGKQEQTEYDNKAVVWGVLYEMTAEDGRTLDTYEGVDCSRPKASPNHPYDQLTRPYEQGDGEYNKWYAPVTVTKWLDEDHRKKVHGFHNTITGADGTVGFVGGDHALQRVLVYVDEHHTKASTPKEEYIARMNRGIRESVELGIPKDWVDEIIRKYIPEGP